MGLSQRLASAATAGAHLLVVEAPGAWRVRVAVEQEAARRGWRMALSPADADVLVVCGDGLSEPHEAAVEAVWDQVPGPRVRIQIQSAEPQGVATTFQAATRQLLDDAAQREDASSRAGRPVPVDGHEADHDAMDHDAMDHDTMGHGGESGDAGDGGMDHDAADHDAMDHDGMGHDAMGHGHGGMDHGGMDMTGPGGIALASGGSDRDGLDMDVLHLPLGPVLPYWPPGLVVTLTLQGDVTTNVVVNHGPDIRHDLAEMVGSSKLSGVAPGRDTAASRCDAVVSVLTLAGASRLAGRARVARDQLLDPTITDATALASVTGLQRVVRRSWLLRWSLRGLAPVEAGGGLQGDVHARLLRLVDVAADETRTGTRNDGLGEVDGSLADLSTLIPPLLVGVELATVRLAVASVVGFHESAEASVKDVR